MKKIETKLKFCEHPVHMKIAGISFPDKYENDVLYVSNLNQQKLRLGKISKVDLIETIFDSIFFGTPCTYEITW